MNTFSSLGYKIFASCKWGLSQSSLYFLKYLCACSGAQWCLNLCNAMDCSPPGSSFQEIFQARTLEWVAISSGSSRPRDRTCTSCTGRRACSLPLSHLGSPHEVFSTVLFTELIWTISIYFVAQNSKNQSEMMILCDSLLNNLDKVHY